LFTPTTGLVKNIIALNTSTLFFTYLFELILHLGDYFYKENAQKIFD